MEPRSTLRKAWLTIALVLALLLGASAPSAHAGPIWNGIVKLTTGKTPRQHQQARHIRDNQRHGAKRERQVERRLKVNPFTQHWTQPYLLDSRGDRLKDPVTGQARRLDFATRGPLGGYRLIEVTGPRTNKSAQNAKTDRIVNGRRNIFVKLDGELVNLGRHPRIERWDRN